MFTRKLALAALALGGLGFGQAAQAQGALNVYCSVQNEWCQAIVTNFQRDSGIRDLARPAPARIAQSRARPAPSPPKPIFW